MKYLKSIIFAMVLVGSVNLWAQEDKNLGVGFILGEPTALSLKYYTSEETAFDVQGSITGDEYFLFWADYLFHSPNFVKSDVPFFSRLNPYVGIGIIGAFASKSDHDRGNYFDKRDDDFAVGARVPFGVEWFWKRVPLAIGLELTPGVIVAPATQGILQGGLSLRFYF